MFAVLSGIDIQGRESVRDRHIKGAVCDVTQAILQIADELVAGIDIPFRRDCHIFASGTAAPHPFDDTGALTEIYIEVEEIEIVALEHLLCQPLIFSKDARQIFLTQAVRCAGFRDNRFDRLAVKP